MNPHHCCQKAPRAGGDRLPCGSWLRRVRETAGWIVPSAILALLPKCPMCLAAYVALGTGFTLSYASAHVLLRTLTLLCVSTLAFSVVRRMMKHLSQKQSLPFQTTNTSR